MSATQVFGTMACEIRGLLDVKGDIPDILDFADLSDTRKVSVLPRTSLLARAFQKASPGVSPDRALKQSLRDAVRIDYFLWRWAHYGLNVFSLTEGLAAGLVLTQRSHEKAQTHEELRLPFPAFMVTLPKNTVPVFLSGGRQAWVDAIWVHAYKNQGREMFLWDAYYSQEFVECYAERRVNELDESLPTPSTLFEDDPPQVPEDQVTRKMALHVVRNLCDWLGSVGGISSRAPENASCKKAQRSGPRDWPTHWVMGREVKLARPLRELAPLVALAGSSKRPEGWKIRMQHFVRGHVKPRLSERLGRPVFICPYWRGPEGAEAWSHLYQGAVVQGQS